MSRILQKKSFSAGIIPSALNLQDGEIAINFEDGIIYGKHSNGTIVNLTGALELHTHTISQITGLQTALDGKVPLNGTGATGTWGISITGNAASASSVTWANVSGKPTTLSGYGVTALNVAASTTASDPATYNVTGITYANSVSLFGQTDGALYANSYSTLWQHQIFGDYRTGQIAIRGKNNGTFTGWRTVLDSSNYNTYAPTLTGTGATGTWGISITGNAATVTNGVYTTGTYSNPSWITSIASTKISGTLPSSALAGTYTININGTVGSVTPNTGSFTQLKATSFGIGGDPSSNFHIHATGQANALTPGTISKVSDFAAANRFGFSGLVNNSDVIYFGTGVNGGIGSGIGFYRDTTGWRTGILFYTNNLTGGSNPVDSIQVVGGINADGNLTINSVNGIAMTPGKQLSTEDYTTAEKNKLAAVKNMANRDVFISTSAPTSGDGADGDIWLQY